MIKSLRIGVSIDANRIEKDWMRGEGGIILLLQIYLEIRSFVCYFFENPSQCNISKYNFLND